MKLTKALVLALSCLPLCALSASGTKVELNYDGFFDRMDDLADAEYQGIKLAFYYKDRANKPCPVASAKLATKLKSQDVYILDSGEILLPYEPLLDQDKAILVIEQQDQRECGLNMRLESNQLFDRKVKVDAAKALTQTFATAFDDLGGMMSFMLPKVQGVTFQFEQDVNATLTADIEIKCLANQGCTLLQSDLNEMKGDLVFSHKPTKAVPFIK